MKKLDVGKDFHHRLVARFEPYNNTHTAKHFKDKYLAALDDQDFWKNPKEPFIELDFTNVDVISPSFARAVFAHYLQYTDEKTILRVIKLTNITTVKKQIIQIEFEAARQMPQTIKAFLTMSDGALILNLLENMDPAKRLTMIQSISQKYKYRRKDAAKWNADQDKRVEETKAKARVQKFNEPGTTGDTN